MTRSLGCILGAALTVLLGAASCGPGSAVDKSSAIKPGNGGSGLIAPVPSNVNLAVLAVKPASSTSAWVLFKQDLGPVVSAEHVAYTADGGSHWVDRTPPVPTGDEIGGSVFIDGQNAWIATVAQRRGCPCLLAPGTVTVFRTRSGGQTWSASHIRVELPAPLYLVALNPPLAGWASVSGVAQRSAKAAAFCTRRPTEEPPLLPWAKERLSPWVRPCGIALP
jgi:hypothetical protein